MILRKNNQQINVQVENGRAKTTIKINGRFVSNPLLSDLINDGWVEYTPTPVIYTPSYEERVVELIRQQYSINDELALLRQRDTKPQEFAQYNTFVEQCKQTAKEEISQQ